MKPAAATFHARDPAAVGAFANAVIEGLSARRKAIPCQFLYDAAGSALFDRICELPEYYPTRTEVSILDERAQEIAGLIGPRAQIIELGSGSSYKIRRLLGLLQQPAAYVPIDISASHLESAANAVARAHPEIPVTAVCADYMEEFSLPASLREGYAKRLVFFPGSTVGNLTQVSATRFLGRMRRLAGSGSELLIGVDLQKDPARLHAAYNDAAGVTPQFTLNLLRRINRELDGNLDVSAFAHDAFYNPELGRIEIYLKSLVDQTARIAGQEFSFASGERIHTEYSYKYTIEGFQALARTAGYEPVRCWTDADKLFSVHYFRAT